MKKFVSLSTGLRIEYVEQGKAEAEGVPVIFLHGVTDSWRSFEPKAQFIAYEGFGHAFHWEDPKQFAKDLVPFLTPRSGSDSRPQRKTHAPPASGGECSSRSGKPLDTSQAPVDSEARGG